MQKFQLALFLIIISCSSIAQNVGIGTNTPNPSAVLDITDSSRGLLIPRVTINQRLAIQNPAEGLMVYQTDSIKGFWYFENGNWRAIVSQATTNQIMGGMHILTFNTGTHFWRVPDGVSSVIVEMWGGGGGGSANVNGGKFGGAGGYGRGSVNVTPGNSIQIIVGAGGSACACCGGCNGWQCSANSGQSTTFGNLLFATGGEGGTSSDGGYSSSGISNAQITCTSSTNIPCVQAVGFNYGKGGKNVGATTCNSGPLESIGINGNDGFLILTY